MKNEGKEIKKIFHEDSISEIILKALWQDLNGGLFVGVDSISTHV